MSGQNNTASDDSNGASSDSEPQLPLSTAHEDPMQVEHNVEVTPTPSTSGRQAKRTRSDSDAEPDASDAEPEMKKPKTKEDIKQCIETAKEIRDQIKPRYMLFPSIFSLLDNELKPLPDTTSCNNCNNCSSCNLRSLMRSIWRISKGGYLNKCELESVAIVAITAAFGSTLTRLITDKSHMREIIKFYFKHFQKQANNENKVNSFLKKFQKVLSDPAKKRWFCYTASMSGKFETKDIGEFYDNWTNWTNAGNIEEQPTRNREPGSYQRFITSLAQYARHEMPNYPPGDKKLMLEVIRELEK